MFNIGVTLFVSVAPALLVALGLVAVFAAAWRAR